MKVPCLKDIEEIFIFECWQRERKKFLTDVEMKMFSQTWESTALGFDGIGGDAMTNAYTVICHDNHFNYWGVFFNGKFAYLIKDPNDKFLQDLKDEQMCSVNQCEKYEKEVSE